MASLSNALTFAAVATAGIVSAYAPPCTLAGTRTAAFRPSKTTVYENFGVDFAEDQAENTPDIILGEANLKQWVGTVNDNSFLNRQYNLVRRIRENGLLKATSEAKILTRLEDNGIDLVTLENLLPLVEKLRLLTFAANNQQLLINGAAPLLTEPAPYILPAIGAALEVGPPAFFAAAAFTGGIELALNLNHVKIPFIGLPADVLIGALLVPATGLFGIVGLTLVITNAGLDFDEIFEGNFDSVLN